MLAAFSTGSGKWSLGVPLPNAAVPIGMRAALQAVLGPTPAPAGADLKRRLWSLRN